MRLYLANNNVIPFLNAIFCDDTGIKPRIMATAFIPGLCTSLLLSLEKGDIGYEKKIQA